MKTITAKLSIRSLSLSPVLVLLGVAFVAAVAQGCTEDMVLGVNASLRADGGAGGTAVTGAGGAAAATTFACGTGTCDAETEFCVRDPSLTHCVPLPQACAGVTGTRCGCVCQTQGGGPGFCPSPEQLNEGGRQCSCQNVGATTNAMVWCQ